MLFDVALPGKLDKRNPDYSRGVDTVDGLRVDCADMLADQPAAAAAAVAVSFRP